MMKKSLFSTVIAASMAITGSADAYIIDFNWDGLFTMTGLTDSHMITNPGPDQADAFGLSTFVSGTLSFDTATGLGSATMDHFVFQGNTLSLTPGLTTMTAIGDGMGGPGTLALFTMDINLGPASTIPAYQIGDAAGFFGAIGSGPGTALSIGDVITGVGATSSTLGNIHSALAEYANPALSEPMPFAMTTFDAQQNEEGALTGTPCHPSGILGCALTDDGFSGVTMATPPYPGRSVNLDITTMTVVPIPAATWLFGSGLIGLMGIARRK